MKNDHGRTSFSLLYTVSTAVETEERHGLSSRLCSSVVFILGIELEPDKRLRSFVNMVGRVQEDYIFGRLD